MNIDRRAALTMALGMLLPVPAFASPAAEMETLLSETPWIGDAEPTPCLCGVRAVVSGLQTVVPAHPFGP
ncbi:exported hypothetical protein [Candidatus Terasakiella magnetica]|nr:exported hypothetical protein [Candidatus Terasakiella magnetica]